LLQWLHGKQQQHVTENGSVQFKGITSNQRVVLRVQSNPENSIKAMHMY